MPKIRLKFMSAIHFVTFVGLMIGCNSPSEKMANTRKVAQELFDQGQTAFTAKDYAAAEDRFSRAVTQGGLGPDCYDIAAVKRAVCLGALNRGDEAIAELAKLEPGASNLDAIYAARSYVLTKQGKAAESRAALAKARQYNRTVQEFKD